ncbi:hypothetical protein Tsubulata_045906 [Turnera subulata]|uniref:TraB domain-containing protein n=1 Tax=Turnera subulata TaxID=218843 RepID=A0A9Q0J2W4_9ROSI|nr:hypothetical protein Tsubulata_045906 [Turnera subulata]
MLGSIRRLTRLATQPYFTAAAADVALRHPSKTTTSCRSTPFSPPLQFPRITTLTSAAGDQSWEGKELPEELSKSVMVLTCDSSAEGGTCHVYVVGTNHVSQKSCRVVQAVVSYLKPQETYAYSSTLTKGANDGTMDSVFEEEGKSDWSTSQPGHSPGMQLLRWAAERFKVLPGSEFRVAFEEANKYNGKVVLGDRPAKITVRRAWVTMPLWHKIKLPFTPFFMSYEFLTKLMQYDEKIKASAFFDPEEDEEFGVLMQALWHETWEKYPTLVKTFVHEREQYMASKLLEVARTSNSVVAVVGKWHLEGIKKHWKQPVMVGVPILCLFAK